MNWGWNPTSIPCSDAINSEKRAIFGLRIPQRRSVFIKEPFLEVVERTSLGYVQK
jgi:hypothetical protein